LEKLEIPASGKLSLDVPQGLYLGFHLT
jgi:hypothetical protein